jgi:uncharacterized membrane protein
MITLILAGAAAALLLGLLVWALRAGPDRRATTWVCATCKAAFSTREAADRHVAASHGPG